MKKGLNKAAIRSLASNIYAQAKKYRQNTLTSREACGTTCCMAGFCKAEEIGTKEFNKLAKKFYLDDRTQESIDFYDSCMEAGVKTLGIKSSNTTPNIFETTWSWPTDLRQEYFDAKTNKGKAIVAIKALSRMNPDGSIDDNPKAVHTRIPELSNYLRAKKGKK